MLLWLNHRFHAEAKSRFPTASCPAKGTQRVAKKAPVAMVYFDWANVCIMPARWTKPANQMYFHVTVPKELNMQVSPQTIWRAPAYLPYLQPKITSQIIRDAEQLIGFSLPSEYLALLEIQNGGYIRYGLEDSVHEMIHGIGPNFPSITNINWEDVRECVSFPLDGLVPFDGDGHWFICLDYRKNPKAPAVSYIDIECDSESIIANSFNEYLHLLKRVIPENDYVITSTANVEFVKKQLAELLGAKFDEPNTYAHGYPIHTARIGRFGNFEGVSLNANIVPCGFVREDDSRYNELRVLMAGEAKIHPELPDECCLIYMTDGVKTKALKALREASIAVRPLADFLEQS